MDIVDEDEEIDDCRHYKRCSGQLDNESIAAADRDLGPERFGS